MKKNIQKLLSFVLILSMLLAVLVSCNTTQNNGDNTTDSTTSKEEVTTEAPAEDLVLVSGGKAHVKVIYPYEGATIEKTIASQIVAIINNLTGVKPESSDDFIPKDETYNSESIEILVGQTGYAESKQVLSTIGYGDYAIQVVGNKLVVAAYSEDALTKAGSQIRRLLNARVSEDKTTLAVESTLADSDTVDSKMATLPIFDGGDEVQLIDMGDDCTQLLVKNIEKSDYQTYVTKLSETFTKKEEREILTENNLYTMLANDQYMVTALYIKTSSQARISIEPLSKNGYADYTNDNTATDVCEPLFLEVGLNPVGGSQQNGMAYIFRLSNGEFLIFDGGWNDSGFTAGQNTKRIVTLLKQYAPNPNDIHIAAWLVTHAHTDHIGALECFIEDYMKDEKNITLENILINLPSDQQAAQPSYGNNNVAEGNNMISKMAAYRTTLSIAKNTGTNIHKTHVGQVLEFGNAKLEVLYTYELSAPTILSNFNNLSIVTRLTVEGQTFLFTGDSSTVANLVMEKMYGKGTFECDFYQVPHHGYGPNDNSFASYVNPTWVLWPVGPDVYDTVKGNSFSEFLFTSKKVQGIYVARFQTHEFKLPFDGSNYTVVDNTTLK